jgi:hypothetical protein
MKVLKAIGNIGYLYQMMTCTLAVRTVSAFLGIAALEWHPWNRSLGIDPIKMFVTNCFSFIADFSWVQALGKCST